jgi:hypothetical protein
MVDITSNLVTHLACQDNAANNTVANTGSTGGNQTLQNAGNTSASSVPGPGGLFPLALDLDGANDYITLPNLTATGGGNWSYMKWIKLEDDTPVAAESGFADLGPMISGAASHYPYIDGSIYMSLLRASSNSVPNRVSFQPFGVAPLTKWHHVAITNTPGANGWTFYVNGTPIAQTTGVTPFFDADAWDVGRSGDGSGFVYMNGAVADVRIYNRTLTSEEIHAVIALATSPITEPSLNTALASASSWRAYTASNGNLQLPPMLTLTNPLSLPYVAGGVIEGLGHAEPVAPNNQFSGPVSNVIWAGARTSGTTMLTMPGQRTVLRNFNLHGATRAQIDTAAVTKVPILVQITNPSSSLGTGGFIFQGICFSYADVGVNSGLVAGGSNCDELTFDKCFFDRLGVGVRVNNHQGMDHVYRECHFRSTPILIDVNAGGHFRVEDCLIANGASTLFNFGSSGSGTGPNNASYRVDGLKIDTQALNSRIINMSALVNVPYYADVYCARVHFPVDNAWQNPAFTISGKTACHVVRCKNLMADMFTWNSTTGQGTPYYHIDGCRLYGINTAADLFDAGSSTGSCRVRVTNCYDADNVAVADYNATL